MLQQKITCHKFRPGSPESFLKLEAPPFSEAAQVFRQLRYIFLYLEALGCRSILREQFYIDRDYMDDHSVFYSRNLYTYQNYCSRLHFFTDAPARLRQKINRVSTLIDPLRYSDLCAELTNTYLGFSVIKPLQGSRIGRTVLRPPLDSPSLEQRFGSIRLYKIHVAAAELEIRGLAFQQQDMGVSACATTALWCSLQKLRDLEEIGAVSPARITELASRHALPLGRPMPSEGLTVDQMCQAIQALGASPNLIRLDDFGLAASCLVAAADAGFAPVLILRRSLTPKEWHAVTVVGIGIAPHVAGNDPDTVHDQAGDLACLFIHDDRFGPYVKAPLERIGTGVSLTIPSPPALGTPEGWIPTHALLPMHSKIRLSFGALREIAKKILVAFNTTRDSLVERGDLPEECSETVTSFDLSVLRAHAYLERLIKDGGQGRIAHRLAASVPLARYLAVVRVSTPYISWLDVIIDTTSTERSSNCLAVVVGGGNPNGTMLGELLRRDFKCPLIS